MCAGPLQRAQQRTAPRPVLGTLRLRSTSPGAPAAIPLEGDLIIGRGPRDARANGCIPIAIGVSGVDISRSHVKVELDGWRVFVTDLSSTNGTWVCIDGGKPQKLKPQIKTEIEVGTSLSLAETVTYRYEVAD